MLMLSTVFTSMMFNVFLHFMAVPSALNKLNKDKTVKNTNPEGFPKNKQQTDDMASYNTTFLPKLKHALCQSRPRHE